MMLANLLAMQEQNRLLGSLNFKGPETDLYKKMATTYGSEKAVQMLDNAFDWEPKLAGIAILYFNALSEQGTLDPDPTKDLEDFFDFDKILSESGRKGFYFCDEGFTASREKADRLRELVLTCDS